MPFAKFKLSLVALLVLKEAIKNAEVFKREFEEIMKQ